MVHPLEIKIASPTDSETLAAFINTAYRGEAAKRGWTTEADLIDGQRTDANLVRREMAKTDSVFLLFLLKEEWVSSVFLQRQKECAYLGMFTVSPNLQASGIGRAALNLIENWVQEKWAAKKIEMNVINSRQELIAWYERRGYHDSGRRKPFPVNEPGVGLPKVALHKLEFLVMEKQLQ